MSGKSKVRVKVERYPLPPSLDGILSLLREILVAGRVQRLEVELGQPIRVSREVDEDPGLEEPDTNLDGQLRNIELIEYASEGASPYQLVVDMTHLLSREGLHSVCWATGWDGTLSRWLNFEDRGLPAGSSHLLNIPVRQLKSLPEDALILCGSPYPVPEIEEITLAVKATMEIRRPKDDHRKIPNREVDGRVRAGPSRSPSAADQLALAARGLREVARDPGTGGG